MNPDGPIHNTPKKLHPSHYHGNIVRWLFLAISTVLLVTFPLIKTGTIIPLGTGIVLVIVLILLAALTTARYRWVHIANAAVALFCVVLFEFLAFATSLAADPVVFFVRQGIALGSLFALYLSVRTALGIFMQKESAEQTVNQPAVDPTKTNRELLHEIERKKQINNKL